MRFANTLNFVKLLTIDIILIGNGFTKYSAEYLEIGKCPCDLTQGRCDTSCCCDPDCEGIQPLPFNCADDYLKAAHFPDLDCSSVLTYDSADWKPFLCLQSEKTPYLGQFFSPPKEASSILEFETTIKSQRRYTPKEIHQANFESSYDGYIQGQPLKVDFSSGISGYLSLPTELWNGHCVQTSPLRYLKSSSVHCAYSGSLSDCGVNRKRPLFIDPETYQLFQNGAQLMGPQAAVPFKSFCLKHKTSPVGYGAPEGLFNVDQDEELVDCASGGLYPKLSLDSAKSVCINAVESVQYDFYWNGTELLNITSTIILVNAAPPIMQMFAVNFLHEDEPFQLPIRSMRSGVFGYDIERPVIALRNGMEKHLYIWKPGRTGECSDVKKSKVLFGVDSSSGCVIHLAAADFKDCVTLRKAVRSNQSKLFEADSILVNGNPTSTKLASVPLLKANESSIDEILANLNDSWKFQLMQDGPGRCGAIPSEIKLEILYADTGHVHRERVYQIFGARIKFEYSTWSVRRSDSNLYTFPVISTVSFVKVPIQRNRKVKKFWDHPDVCTQDVCWKELWYPGVDGSASYEMITSTILCLMFAVPCMWVYATQLGWQK